eukprot:c9016_g1_i3.p1 GENE.c9016_g1_i3~~c9016_g1_i3.p1  ORF type:complete len:460 (+),score=86.04 c9016_g1_i3:79-1380(+)
MLTSTTSEKCMRADARIFFVILALYTLFFLTTTSKLSTRMLTDNQHPIVLNPRPIPVPVLQPPNSSPQQKSQHEDPTGDRKLVSDFSQPGVTLSILSTASDDATYRKEMVRHISSTHSSHQFFLRIIVVDAGPAMTVSDQVRNDLDELVQSHLVDQWRLVDYLPELVGALNLATFGSNDISLSAPSAHGTVRSMYAYVFSTLAAQVAPSRYLLHFDLDINLHQRTGSDWVSEAVRVLQTQPSALAVTPTGRPSDKISAPPGSYAAKPSNSFTSRTFLLDLVRYKNTVLPLHYNPAVQWEAHVAWAMAHKGLKRMTLIEGAELFVVHPPSAANLRRIGKQTYTSLVHHITSRVESGLVTSADTDKFANMIWGAWFEKDGTGKWKPRKTASVAKSTDNQIKEEHRSSEIEEVVFAGAEGLVDKAKSDVFNKDASE